MRPLNADELRDKEGVEIFDCDRRLVQVRKDTGEKRSFQFDSLLEPGIA